MKTLVSLFWAVCLMRKGPEDMPYSLPLLVVVLAVYMVIGLAMHLLSGDVLSALAHMLLDVGLIWLATTLLLYMAGHGARLVQTMTALAGSGALLALIALPIVVVIVSVDMKQGVPLPLGLTWLALVVWSVMVSGSIYARALGWHRIAGVGVAILLLIATLLLSDTLLRG